VSERGDGRVAIFRSFGQSTQDDSIESGRDLLVEGSCGWWLDIEVQIHQVCWWALKRWQADEELIGDDGKRILIGGKHWAADPLFGSHIQEQAIGGTASAEEGGRMCGMAGFSHAHSKLVNILTISVNENAERVDIQMHALLIMSLLKNVCNFVH